MFINLFSNKYNNSQPTFSGRLPKGFFTDVRDVPGIHCAKCGHRMLSIPEKDKIINKMSEGSRTVLQRPVFDKYRELPVFQFLLKISEHHPRTSIADLLEDKINKEEANSLNCSSKDMLKEIIGISKNYIKKSPQVIRFLYKYRDGMPCEYQDLLDYMKIYSMLYPKNTFSEIFSKKEVIEYHKQKQIENQKKINKNNIQAFKKLDNLSKRLPEKLQTEFLNLNNEAKNITNNRILPDTTKKMMLQELYKDFLNKVQDKKILLRIKNQVENIPYRNTTADDCIISLSNKSDTKILNNILQYVSSTFEHIVAASKNGTKTVANGIFLCRKCNRERANVDYSTMIEFFPNFIENIQKQINQIMILIKNGRMGKYSYPFKVIKTLENVLPVPLDTNIKKYIKYLEIREKELYEKKEKAMRRFSQDINRYTKVDAKCTKKEAEIENLRAKLKVLEQEKMILGDEKLVQKETEIKELRAKLKILRKEKMTLEQDLNKSYESVIKAKDRLEFVDKDYNWLLKALLNEE